MAQINQMTRYMSSWLDWTPLDCYLSAKEEPLLQESSGFITMLALYLTLALVLGAVSFCKSGRAEASDASPRLRKKREARLSSSMALAKLIRQVGKPKRARLQRQRLRIRLRRHLEQELKLLSGLQEKGQRLGQQDWQDAEDVEGSTYFDLPSETEII